MKNNKVKFWSRLSDAHLFTWGYLGYHVFSMVSMRLFLNSSNFVEYLGFWLSVVVLEHIFVFTVLGLAKRFINEYSAALVVIGTLVLGICRTLITTSLAIAVGADPGVAWVYQLLLGALWELMLVIVWSNLNGAYREHRKLVSQLNETRNSILSYRENAEVILAEEHEKLLDLTRGSLLPQIQLIEKAIDSGNIELASRWGVANELKGIIQNQVRPLSESLRTAAKSLTTPVKQNRSHFFSVISIPRTFYIKNSIFPTATALTMLLSFLAAPFWLLGIDWVIPSALMSISYFAVLYGLRKLVEPLPEVSALLGIFALVVAAILPVLPTYLLALLFHPSSHDAAIYGSTITFTSVIVVGIFALVDSFDYRAREYRGLLLEQNDELALEMSIFEQQIWAARRSWSLVIHGTVQASLTAALTRLNEPSATMETMELVKSDLDRAKKALTSRPSLNVKFDAVLKELVATWQGVCDIDVRISSDTQNVVKADAQLSMCVNEIIKEAISNAVRHGDARNAQVALNLAHEGVIDLAISNDGTPPSTNSRRGIGSKLLDELTVDWSLGFDSATDQTILTARLPFSRSQA